MPATTVASRTPAFVCRTIVAAALLGVSSVFAQPAAPAATTQPAAAARVEPTDVPVRAVVLFSSGVGYFEHFGVVKGNAASELRFKTAQINDILKSLVLQDLDGGRVSTITYPSQDPVEKTLRSFQVNITTNPPLYGQPATVVLKGARASRRPRRSRPPRAGGRSSRGRRRRASARAA